jgi:bacteriocin-like protein
MGKSNKKDLKDLKKDLKTLQEKDMKKIVGGKDKKKKWDSGCGGIVPQ